MPNVQTIGSKHLTFHKYEVQLIEDKTCPESSR